MKKLIYSALCVAILCSVGCVGCKKDKSQPPAPLAPIASCGCGTDPIPVFTDKGPILSAYAGALAAGDIIIVDTPYQVVTPDKVVNCVTQIEYVYDSILAHAGRPVSGYPHLGGDAASYRSVLSAQDLKEGDCLLEIQYEKSAMILMTTAFLRYLKPVHWLNSTTVIIGNNPSTGIDTLTVGTNGLQGTRTQYTKRTGGIITGPADYIFSRYEYASGPGNSIFPTDPHPRTGWQYYWFRKIKS